MESTRNSACAKLVGSRFSLALFILSRNQIKQSKFKEFRNYIKKNYVLYNKCIEKDLENATLHYIQHIASKGGLSPNLKKQNSSVVKQFSAKPTKKTWQLPPNVYDVNKIPYETKRGIGGAYWPKSRTFQPKSGPFIRQRHTDFYDLTEDNINKSTPCNRAKGYFLTNPRERRATARCMVNCLATCYRNSSDPGPATYSPASITKTFKKSLDIPNPHLFYYSSIVPQKKNVIHNPHTSFTAAPGRYETRYSKSCPCSSRLVYYPQIKLRIDKEKRNKFRNLSYETIKAQNYASPEWRHVKGQGLRYLFMGAKPPLSELFSEQNAKRQKSVKLYADSKYIGMINNPFRMPLSLRPSPITSLKPRIRFNCIPKVITRRHLRINKKTAFGSCQERFQDAFRLPIITLKQREKLKQTLPIERQLRDHPVIYKRFSEINSKLNVIPNHMLSTHVPTLRKRNFKFQPLPQAKVLVNENETIAKIVNTEGFYLRSLEAKNFFKASSNSSSDPRARF